MSVPNQKKIIIERSSDKAKADYFKVSNESLALAMYNLQANAFKLWVYLADNKQGYTLELYPVDFCTKANVSKSTYDRAFKELVEAGYLKQSQKKKNWFMFCEVSSSAAMPDTVSSLDSDSFEKVKEAYFD